MIKLTTRPLLPDEQRAASGGLPFPRSAARRKDASAGHAEVLEFRALRAWKLITCRGPDCCPNTWLLQASPRELVRVESWTHLTARDGAFPGAEVRLSRTAGTHRLLDAEVSGPAIPREWPADESELIPLLVLATEQCQIIPVESLPGSVLGTLGLP